MKKYVALLLAVAVTFSIGTSVFAAGGNQYGVNGIMLADEGTPSVPSVISPEDKEKIREKLDEVKALRETITSQHETLKELMAAITEIRREAISERDWETLKTIREYRRVNIQTKIDILELRLERMDILDTLDEARQNQDVELALEGLDQLIENLEAVVELNEQAIANAEACLDDIQ